MIVILTEKPSVAKDIATFVGARNRREGYFEGNGYQVTWAFGHLIALKDPEDYNPLLKKWSLVTLPFIPPEFQLKIFDDKGIRKQFLIIKKLFKSASQLICATDAGREGELIFRYILEMTECLKKSWRRLWLSSLTEEALKAAFQHLKAGADYDHLYAAARCRNEADWIVGLNGTRNFTVRYGQGKILWSIGRVQTPVLSLIVNRDDEIRFFKSEKFWELFTNYRNVHFKLKDHRFKSHEEAQQVVDAIKDHLFKIVKISKKNENEFPPLLYDLTELQRDMNRKYGMTATDTLQIAQGLYEQKFITYPRTDSRYLTHDMQSQVVQILSDLKEKRGEEIQNLNLGALNFSNRIMNDKKVNDHHAIIPTGKIPSNLPLATQNVYEAIVTRFMAVFYPPCVREVTSIEGCVKKIVFHAKGVKMLIPGWTFLYPKKTEESKEKNTFLEDGYELPLFEKGEEGPHQPLLSEGKTKPPSHYNENTLLGAMETAGRLVEDEVLKEALKEKGIGTPATRASIIETLIKRGYIQRSHQKILATDFGRYLIALIQDPHLKSVELTGDWEAQLKKIEKGHLDPSHFMIQIKNFTASLIAGSDISKINFNEYGDCPKCKNPIIKGKRGFGCSKWQEGCSFVLWKHYNEKEMTDDQVRSLLQKKILFGFLPQSVLVLSTKGDVSEISLPSVHTKPQSFQKKKVYRKK